MNILHQQANQGAAFPAHFSVRGSCRSGFTLIELMVTTGISVIAIGAVMLSYSMTTRGFSAAGNYTDMERNGSYAIDSFAWDARQATGLTAFATSDITLVVATNFTASGAISGTTSVRYYQGTGSNSNSMFRVQGGNTTVVAKFVSSLNFIEYDRNMSTNGLQPSDCKLLQVNLVLRRSTLSNPNTETDLSARVVLRNKIVPTS